MSATLESTAILDSAPETAPDLPAWFAERQRAAWQRFLETPAPTRKDENWRFANLKQLDFSSYLADVPVPEDTGAIIEGSKGVEAPVAKFIFVNETLIEIDSKLPPDVICLPLAEALLLHSDLVEKNFMREDTRLGSAKWAALHEARVSNGLFVHVPEGVEVEGTIEVFHWIAGDKAAIFPHTLIVTGANSKVRVVDYFQSAGDTDAGLCIAFNDLCAGPGSKLNYLAIQAFNEETKVVQINETGVEKDAAATAFVLNTGASWARNEAMCRLTGEGSHSDMLSVSVPARGQEYDQRTFQHHVSPGAYSDLLYKNSLYDKSRTIFSGLIFVDEGAHRTDAYQTCRNLFMSDEAEANSMPGLEINADDVKCSHGSTSAQISDEEIFYLQARGIDAHRARQLIARGFSVEVIERLGDEKVEEMVLRFLDDKFAHIASGGA
ncbi:Fe-S cluster assembly protein SufD [Haloferula sargassicola]|uniref:FeS cluster assembly protein SufD n=1 Tax=Haloferula sargassicola TaxID=490096 RepID=A0ABP9UN54_9BACT